MSASRRRRSRDQADLVEVRRQRVQTRILWGSPPPRGAIRADTRLGMKRRRVCTLEWLTLLPATGPLPQISHRFAMTTSKKADVQDPAPGTEPRV